MSHDARGGAGKKLFTTIREHLSNALIGGLFLMLTGFTPEHWIVELLHALHISPDLLKSWAFGLDPRLLLMLFGVAVVVGDILLRRKTQAPRELLAGASPIPAAEPASPAPNASPRREAAALALPDRPSIAVLPFQNMSGDPEQEYFADGMVEEVITALSRIRWLFVIARNSSFVYKGRAVDIKHVGRELGVRYVLEGSVRKAGDRVRITGQLIDCTTGAHIWADRIDGGVEDIFNLQDQVTASVVGAIAAMLEQAEIDRAKRKSTDSLDAYDYYLRGMASIYQGKKETVDEALRLFGRATEIDANFGAAYGMAAYCYVWRKANGWVGDRAHETAEAASLARKAADVGRDDAVALSEAGFALAFVVGELDHGAALITEPSRSIRIWRRRGVLAAIRVSSSVTSHRHRPFATGHSPEPARSAQFHRAQWHCFGAFLRGPLRTGRGSRRESWPQLYHRGTHGCRELFTCGTNRRIEQGHGAFARARSEREQNQICRPVAASPAGRRRPILRRSSQSRLVRIIIQAR